MTSLTQTPPGVRLKRTAEVRWFYEGEPAPEAVAWFHAVGGPDVPDGARSDVYLRTGSDALNVKHREGRLETKRRTQEGRSVDLPSGTAGLLEHWEKWSLGGPNLPDRLPDDPRWIAVGKARRLCQFVPESGGVRPARPQETAPAECNVELTRLDVGGAPWWSICFEASARAGSPEGLLLKTAAHTFTLHPPPPLDAAHSFSYARWLLNLGFGV